MDIRSHMDNYTEQNTIPESKIGVFISGGLDSAIVLYHLKTPPFFIDVNAYTVVFEDPNENLMTPYHYASDVATELGVKLKLISLTAKGYLKKLPDIMRDFDKPRFNVWPWWLMDEAKKAGCSQVWIGEGGDEVFGYLDRGYLEGWAGQLIYIYPTYKRLAEIMGLRLHAPFQCIKENIAKQYKHFYEPPNKMRLRQAYDGILPPEILLRPASPPDFIHYDRFFGRENAKEWLYKHTLKTWLEVHS